MNINKHAEALQFGYGVFETMLFKDGHIESFDAHMQRLHRSLIYLNMPGVNSEVVEELIKEETKHITKPCYVIKLTCLLDGNVTRIVVTTRDMPYHDEDYKKGYNLVLSGNHRHSKNLILRHKTTNILSSKLEMQKIKTLGYHESIHLNENNHISEGIYSNVFFVKEGCLYTPHIDCGLLPGIVRMRVIKLSEKLGIPIKIGYYSIKDLTDSEEIFLTSSVLGIMPVISFNHKTYDLENNKVSQLLNKELVL